MTMKPVAKSALPVLLFALFFALSPNLASAQNRHPAYLHALSDLRAARAHLQREDGGELRHEEKEAIQQIDAAINEIKKASIDDGKDLNEHLPVDARLDRAGRLHRAMELLNKAHQDISREEDNQFAQGLQQRAMGHIDKAHHEVQEAINWVSSHS
jgi:tetratricopeptide (TPR) repeat protein